MGVATTLDNAFENLMEGWTSPIERAMGRRPSGGAAEESPAASPAESPVAASAHSRHSSGGRGGMQGLLPRALHPQDSVDYLAELWGNRKTLSSMIGPKAPSTPPPQRQKQCAREEHSAAGGEEAGSVHRGLAAGASVQQDPVAVAVRPSNRGAALAPADDWDASWDDAAGQRPPFHTYFVAFVS